MKPFKETLRPRGWANGVFVNTEELRRLRAELDKLSKARVKVGVLGDKADRFDIMKTGPQDSLNNPTIGLIHEFGTKGEGGRKPLPPRSWLRMPLMSRLNDEIDKIGRAVWRRVILKQGLAIALGDLGTIATNLIHKAFESGGFGQWAKLSAYTIKKKGSSAILIDSAQLRKAVAYEVVTGGST